MKYLLFVLLFTSCVSQEIKEPKKPLSIVSSNGSGMSYSESTIRCDSVQMLSTKEAFVWVDGTKMKIYAERCLRVYSNSGL